MGMLQNTGCTSFSALATPYSMWAVFTLLRITYSATSPPAQPLNHTAFISTHQSLNEFHKQRTLNKIAGLINFRDLYKRSKLQSSKPDLKKYFPVLNSILTTKYKASWMARWVESPSWRLRTCFLKGEKTNSWTTSSAYLSHLDSLPLPSFPYTH